MLQCTTALKLVQDEALKILIVCHADDRILAAISKLDALLLLDGDKRYLSIHVRPKKRFSINEFNKARALYVSALRTLFLEIDNIDRFLNDPSKVQAATEL